MRYISASLRQLVTERAENRCEYCGLSQIGQAATFHIDHVMPLAEGGQTVEGNLALACVSCSLRKSARIQHLTRKQTVMQTFMILETKSGMSIFVGKVYMPLV